MSNCGRRCYGEFLTKGYIMTDTGIAFDESGVTISDLADTCNFNEQPGSMRFMNGVLQQEWIVTRYKNGCPVSAIPEWRDVPHETDTT